MATAAQLDALDQALIAAHTEIGNAKATQAAADTAAAAVTAAQSTADSASKANTDELVKVKTSTDAVTAAIAAVSF